MNADCGKIDESWGERFPPPPPGHMRTHLAGQADQMSALEEQLAALQGDRERMQREMQAAAVESERLRTENTALRERAVDAAEGMQLLRDLASLHPSMVRGC